MKTWVLRLSKGLNLIVLPAMTIAAPTMPLVFQLGYGVVVLMIAHRAVEEWRQPNAVRADRIVAAFTVTGLVLSGVLLMLMMASAIYRFIRQPSTPFISQV
jgi:hypothetical protein